MSPTRSPITTVVFDLGNVLIPWDRRDSLARFIDDEDELERVVAEVFTMEVNELLDAGRPIADVRAAVEAVHPGASWVVDGYVENFRHSLGPLIEGTARLVDDLIEGGVRCIGLSNWSAVCWDGIPEAFPVLQRLEGIVISGHIAMLKPDPAIFRHLETRFALTPSEILFFDDSEPNVAGARSAGWNAEVFTSPDAARRDVVRAGLLDR